MKLKSIISNALIAVAIAGMGATTIEASASEATATVAVKKKTTRKKAASTTTVSLDNKTFKGTYYGAMEEDWEVFFQPGFVCLITTPDTTHQGTYKVKGNKLTITYWNGYDITMTFDIKNKGTQLYYEESSPRHVYECELNLVK